MYGHPSCRLFGRAPTIAIHGVSNYAREGAPEPETVTVAKTAGRTGHGRQERETEVKEENETDHVNTIHEQERKRQTEKGIRGVQKQQWRRHRRKR